MTLNQALGAHDEKPRSNRPLNDALDAATRRAAAVDEHTRQRDRFSQSGRLTDEVKAA